MSDPLNDFLRQGLMYGSLDDKQILISPSALGAIKEKNPTNIEEVPDAFADGYFLGAFGVRIPYVVRGQMAKNTAVMFDRKLVSRLDP